MSLQVAFLALTGSFYWSRGIHLPVGKVSQQPHLHVGTRSVDTQQSTTHSRTGPANPPKANPDWLLSCLGEPAYNTELLSLCQTTTDTTSPTILVLSCI
ncbi:hypothetical protein Pcinc_030147 [Petrolisthes cinctipes]|uniref:Uncharacterized protein n=1 Tax=Petrolisthes cinctipes TaxID=88211 RepID=A0AAE1K4N7_PETCI|nr:hypothetical protein Pcinc_030147 [Petrolisthes cinctipes]